MMKILFPKNQKGKKDKVLELSKVMSPHNIIPITKPITYSTINEKPSTKNGKSTYSEFVPGLYMSISLLCAFFNL